jgi:gliding motility-associated-like protein
MASFNKISALLALSFLALVSSAQNLVINPSFENVNMGSLNCSWYTTAAGFNNAINNWTLPTGGSSDIFHTSLATSCYCSTNSTHGDNPGQQNPRTGNSYVNIVTHGSGGCTPYREYVQGQLSAPLIAGQTYEVELYVSLADKMNKGTNNIGIKFSQTPYWNTSMCVYNTVPDLNYTGPIIMDKLNWTQILFTYTPTVSGLQNFIIGNFYSDANTLTQASPTGWHNTIRYYVDDVSIVPLNVSSAGSNGALNVCTTDTLQNLFSALGGLPSATGTWSGPSSLTGGHLGTFDPNVHLPGEYTYTVVGGTPSSAIVTVTTTQPQTSNFVASGTFCEGATIPNLPTTSTNGIIGTWSPAINNQQTTTYTFTPNANQCAFDTTLTISITPNLTPTFPPVETHCLGATIPPLPSSSLNGISGTWSPAINNTQTTTYTFTPNAGLCSSTATQTITINQVVTPTFSSVGPYCFGQTVAQLPTNSLNGVIGTWSPQINPNVTTQYTFTPTNSNCAIESTLTITINQNTTPTFNAVGPFCAESQIPLLPTISNNGVIGTWLPAINNTQTTTYEFTPDASLCATTQTLTVEVIPNITPAFEAYLPYCSGANIPNLPETSLNGVPGTWSPAINNLSSQSYTFTPNPYSTSGICAINSAMPIEINPPIQSTTNETICAESLPFIWNNLTISQSGQFQVLLSTNAGCDSIANLNLTVLPNLTSTTLVAICENQLPFVWNGLSLTAPGASSVSFSSALGCDSIAILNLIIHPMPEVSFSTLISEGCAPVTVQFSNTSNVQNANCVWNLGNGTIINTCDMVSTNYNTGCYDIALEVTSQEGCTSTLVMPDMVCIEPHPTAAFTVNPNVLNTIHSAADFTNNSIGHVSQVWNFGDDSPTSNEENPSHTFPSIPGMYNVNLTVANANGCLDSVSQVIVVENEVIFYIPNTFTPDGDAFNNVFLPVFTEGFDPYNYNLLIFNRWGEVLFESNNAKVGWDGTYSGELVMSGTYIYQISYKEIDKDKRQVIRGSVHLLK